MPKKSPKRKAPQPGELASPTAPPEAVGIVPSPTSKDPPAAGQTMKATPEKESNKPADKKDADESGGLSEFKKPDQVISRVVSKVEDNIKARINELRKTDPPLQKSAKLEIVGYRSIVVAGFIHFAKIKISGGSFIQARILETPKGDISLQSVTETKTADDEVEYFKLPKSTVPAAVTTSVTSAPIRDKENLSEKEDLESELETGGLSKFRNIDHVITRIVSKVEDEIKGKINEIRKEEPPLDTNAKLEIVGYRSNIVAGYIYFAKIKISRNSFIQARILESLKGDISLQSVTETETEADEKEYFKLP